MLCSGGVVAVVMWMLLIQPPVVPSAMLPALLVLKHQRVGSTWLAETAACEEGTVVSREVVSSWTTKLPSRVNYWLRRALAAGGTERNAVLTVQVTGSEMDAVSAVLADAPATKVAILTRHNAVRQALSRFAVRCVRQGVTKVPHPFRWPVDTAKCLMIRSLRTDLELEQLAVRLVSSPDEVIRLDYSDALRLGMDHLLNDTVYMPHFGRPFVARDAMCAASLDSMVLPTSLSTTLSNLPELEAALRPVPCLHEQLTTDEGPSIDPSTCLRQIPASWMDTCGPLIMAPPSDDAVLAGTCFTRHPHALFPSSSPAPWHSTLLFFTLSVLSLCLYRRLHSSGSSRVKDKE
jgi:hypothetical protein